MDEGCTSHMDTSCEGLKLASILLIKLFSQIGWIKRYGINPIQNVIRNWTEFLMCPIKLKKEARVTRMKWLEYHQHICRLNEVEQYF